MSMLRFRRQMKLAACAAAVMCCACVLDPASLFNEQFLSGVGLNQQAAVLPGAAPTLLVTIDNRTTRTIEAFVSYRLSGDDVDSFVSAIPPGASTGQALVCPIEEITLGNIADLDAPGALIRLGDGTADDPVIEVEPFGVLLKQGVNYDCGDALMFAVTPSSQTRSGFRTVVFVQRAP